MAILPVSRPVLVCLLFFVSGSVFVAVSRAQDASQLTLDYYKPTCPTALGIIRSEMECAVRADPRNAAAMIRLHFHDCFVQGCDGSVLLDDTYTVKGEKTAKPNKHSLIGFELVDRIKNKLEAECPGAFSCADLLAVAARDATILVGGPYWDVPLGRKDSKTASPESAHTDIPMPDQGLLTLISKFIAKGLSATDMVALVGKSNINVRSRQDARMVVGSHTVGMARCVNFRKRIHGEYQYTAAANGPISEAHLEKLQADCPLVGSDNNVTAMDYVTPTLFDNSFFQLLVRGEGLLDSDQVMYSSMLAFETGDLVRTYARDAIAFFRQFSDSMVKMGNITNPKGGEVRKNCRYI
ncbi:hypothetical protein Taro_005489 [Colocasia esculenta]|uniref:Peroxidase n=1 Tax=Colocasia esculenta TaxID=4460 RepID=A0A843TUQ0_COLES|nr:hypothetical protein [Colocasia esculenta]